MGLCTGPDGSNLEFGCNWLIGLHNPTTIYIHTSETKQWKLTWNPSWCIVKVATFQENIYENPQCFLEKENGAMVCSIFSRYVTKPIKVIRICVKFIEIPYFDGCRVAFLFLLVSIPQCCWWNHGVYPHWNLPAKQVPNNCDACLATTAFTKAAYRWLRRNQVETGEFFARPQLLCSHDGSMVLLYMVTWIPCLYAIYTPVMLAYIPAPWILCIHTPG